MQPLKRILTNKKIPEPGKGIFERLAVRPSKKNTRLFIDNEYFEKGYARLFPKNILAVYCVLAKYANYQTQTCFPSIDIIMHESGIKRRNTVVDNLKILEAYSIIHIEHSKGWSPNQYALLSSDVWKKPDSINIDTALKTKRILKTVSENKPKQYQKQSSNSISSDTGNHLIKSSNEIMDKIKKSSNKETNLGAPLSEVAFLVLKFYYQEKDILQAISSLREGGKEISFRSVKDLLKLWSENGKIIPIKDMKW
jgi:hypothetical protein